MSRSLKRLGAFFLATVTAAMFAPMGCAINEQSIYVHGCLLMPRDQCSVTADPTAEELFSGALQPGFGNGYRCPLLVSNEMLERGNKDKSRIETSGVQLYAAEVQ